MTSERWWQFWRREPVATGSAVELRFPPDGAGKWRFSRLDGRFVFDYADGIHVGFASKTFCDVDAFAKHVSALEADVQILRDKLAESETERKFLREVANKHKQEGGEKTHQLADSQSREQALLSAEHRLSAAYVRLRELIPGALNSPPAPTPEQVWRIAEDCVRKLVALEQALREALQDCLDELGSCDDSERGRKRCVHGSLLVHLDLNGNCPIRLAANLLTPAG